ncbi:MAG: 16S rRNA (cytidine(1402)-2'-O)-methyltransferase [Blastocatellia bacterium]|nr:16S rRNA (cytidine(1402)-2'-O)-methyltransferase [Blastocatellia bacterium]
MPLYLVATPIGNLEDITLRALRVLKEVDLIACEDTRHTRRLLDHFGISKPTISYHDHNERERSVELVGRLLGGEDIALVTDAGTPGISDPAYRIVKAAIESSVEVVPIPGAAAVIAALIASGLPTDSFKFTGFLPPKKAARRKVLEGLQAERATLVFYEAPHRIRETLADAREILGNREGALARELTKIHEQFMRGSLEQLGERVSAENPRGEMTLVIAGNRDDNLVEAADLSGGPIREDLERLLRTEGITLSAAIKLAARARGLTKRQAYQMLLAERGANDDDDETSYDED